MEINKKRFTISVAKKLLYNFEDNHFEFDHLRVFRVCFPFDVDRKHKNRV